MTTDQHGSTWVNMGRHGSTRINTELFKAASLESVNVSLSPAFFHRCPRFPICFAPFDSFAFIVRLFAFGKAQRNLNVAVLEVHAGGNERHTSFDRAADQLADFLAVQQKLPLASGFVIRITAMTVRLDVDVVDPDFAAVHSRKAVPQVDVAFPNRFHFGSNQLDARFERLEDVVIVKRLPVLCDVLLRLLSFRFHVKAKDLGLTAQDAVV